MGEQYEATQPFDHAGELGQIALVPGQHVTASEIAQPELDKLVEEGYLIEPGGEAEQGGPGQIAHRSGPSDGGDGSGVEGAGAGGPEPFDGAASLNAPDYVNAATAAADEAGTDEGREAILRAAIEYEETHKERSTVLSDLRAELGGDDLA